MEMDRVSASLPTFPGAIENPDLRDSLKALEVLAQSRLQVLDWGSKRVAIPFSVKVDLPSLGNFQNIDIREVEPVLLVFDLINYPLEAPGVFTDRPDFPQHNLAHLYIATENRPPGFCYVRGNANEWYANKRINDVLIRISNWLRDAAIGELTEDGQQFEPLRLEGYIGTIIYDYKTMLGVLSSKNAFHFGKRLAIALFERPRQAEGHTYKFVKAITAVNAVTTIKDVDNELKKGQDDVTKKNYHYGYIIWCEDGLLTKDYYVNLPKNWDEFKSFCSFYGVKHDELEKFIATMDGNSFVHFPVIVGINRPSPIIGYSSNVEFINFRFRVDTDDVKQEAIINNLPVDLLSHNQPLTRELAQQISNNKTGLDTKCVVFGCGALGSKIVMHLARSGLTNLILIDPDHLSPHNLIRHALFAADEGENKAMALIERIKEMYPSETLMVAGGSSFKEGFIDKKETFDRYNWILDFTAADAFFNKLVSLKSINDRDVARAIISDSGNLGIMLKEGNTRNPRVDDLQAYLYSLSATDKNISDWLQREHASNRRVTVQVGIGCNSETTVLQDDKISSHAAYFSAILKRQISTPTKEGRIFLNHIIESEDYTVATQTIHVKPFKVFSSANDTTWDIRIKDGIIEQIEHEFIEAGKNETGGVFVGVCNYKTKTIHVTESIMAPIDSKADETNFKRGYEGLSMNIERIQRESGSQIGYIGEWHSHPEGPNELSKKDMASVQRYKAELAELNPPLPVFLSIITPDGFYPYIF